MIVYIMIVAFLMLCSLSMDNQDTRQVLSLDNAKIKQKSRALIFCIATVLIFFAGVRFRVGADYGQYASSYKHYATSKLEFFNEPGIFLVSRLSQAIYDDYATMFFMMSLLTVGLCVSRIAKESPFWAVSILLYVFLGTWHESFNSVRQSAAAAILFFGHRYLKEKNFFKWLLICLIGFLFHVSAIVFVFAFFIPKKDCSYLKITGFFLLGIVLAFFYDNIWELIGFLQNEEYVMDEYSKSRISIFRIIVAWVPIIFYKLFIEKIVDEKDKREVNFYAILSLLSAAIMLAARYSAYLGRMVIYTDIYNAILWGYMLKILSSKQKDFASKYILIIGVLGCYFVYYLFEASGEFIVNYQWIFSR